MKLLTASEFWRNVDSLMIDRKINLTELSEASHISYKTISVQRSRQSLPKIDKLLDIANTLNVSLELLVTGHGGPVLNLSERASEIARACETASEGDLYAIEKILGIQKIYDDPISNKEEIKRAL